MGEILRLPWRASQSEREVNKMSAIRRVDIKYTQRLSNNNLKRNWEIITIIVAFIILCLILAEAVGLQLIFSDGAGYYCYLPAVFIDHDISMKTMALPYIIIADIDLF